MANTPILRKTFFFLILNEYFILIFQQGLCISTNNYIMYGLRKTPRENKKNPLQTVYLQRLFIKQHKINATKLLTFRVC